MVTNSGDLMQEYGDVKLILKSYVMYSQLVNETPNYHMAVLKELRYHCQGEYKKIIPKS